MYFKYKIKVIKNPKIRILFPTKIGLTNIFKVILFKLFNVLKMKLSKIYDIGIIDNNLKNIKFFSLTHFGDENKIIYKLPINNLSRLLL